MINSRKVKLFLRENFGNSVLLAEWFLGKKFPIFLDYPINPIPRYGFGKPYHKRLYALINENSEIYKKYLVDFTSQRDPFFEINVEKESGLDLEPYLRNDFFPVFDAFVLYSFLALNNPRHHFEIGSGESTKFVRRAIKDFGLRTEVTSIDPSPRSRIDKLCDVVVRKSVEDIDLEFFQSLEEGDILFVDSSHRVFQNSDVTVCFLDIIPYLKPGVLVHFHDILLPWDYSKEYGGERYYSEQYLLAAFILGEGNRFEVIMPNYFVSKKANFSKSLQQFQIGKLIGSSFWIRMN